MKVKGGRTTIALILLARSKCGLTRFRLHFLEKSYFGRAVKVIVPGVAGRGR